MKAFIGEVLAVGNNIVAGDVTEMSGGSAAAIAVFLLLSIERCFHFARFDTNH